MGYFDRVFSFKISRNSEGINFKLFWCEIKKVVCVQIKAKPYQYYNRKDNEACTVFHGCKEGKQEDPENGVIGFANKGERVGECLLNCCVVCCVFS